MTLIGAALCCAVGGKRKCLAAESATHFCLSSAWCYWLLSSPLLRLWLMNRVLLGDSLPASSVDIITSTVDGQHDPLFWRATGVRLALAGQSVSTNRLAAEGSPDTPTTAQGRVGMCVFVCWWGYRWEHARKCVKHFTWKKCLEVNACAAVYTHEHACMCVSVNEREGGKKVADSATLPPPTRLAAKTSAGEFV